MIEDYKNGNLPIGTENEKLWEAQKIKQVISQKKFVNNKSFYSNFSKFKSMIHPDTNEKIIMPLRWVVRIQTKSNFKNDLIKMWKIL